MFGFLVINKPQGLSSRGALNQLTQAIRPAKIGHAGTLDPLATGVLVAGIGPATRLTSYVQRMPKTYAASFRFGLSSDTEDLEGTVTSVDNPPLILESTLRDVLPQFCGTISQLPPQYSALKIDGKRAYELARSGKHAPLKPRSVTVHRLELTHFEYPDFDLEIHCGSGTYVRSLGRDLAQAVGTSAVMTALTRTAIGRFSLAQAVGPDNLNRDLIQQNLLPATQAVTNLPTSVISRDQIIELSHGSMLDLSEHGGVAEIAVVDSDGLLVSIMKTKCGKQYFPAINFAHDWIRRHPN